MKNIVVNQVKLIEAIYKYGNSRSARIEYDLDKAWEKDMQPTIFIGKIKDDANGLTVYFKENGTVSFLAQGSKKEAGQKMIEHLISNEKSEKQNLYDFLYDKKIECFNISKKHERNLRFKELKKWISDNKENLSQYKQGKLSEIDAMCVKQNFRQEYLRYKSSAGGRTDMINQLFQPYLDQWEKIYGLDFSGVKTKERIFWTLE
ncbi:hypothetical protein [Burkholderia cepacia]|uniref:hypothetical protein n=1 Tax=Burkholderia cepacia TaxID=292 RepID=UPI00158B86BF|nr:hypothetical protein [Burkholderia cepacia]